MIGLIIFIVVIAVFLILYFQKGLYEALLISGIISTLGVLFIPDYPLFSFYIRIAGTWRLIIISMNEVKVIVIIGMVLFMVYMRENRAKFKGVIS